MWATPIPSVKVRVPPWSYFPRDPAHTAPTIRGKSWGSLSNRDHILGAPNQYLFISDTASALPLLACDSSGKILWSVWRSSSVCAVRVPRAPGTWFWSSQTSLLSVLDRDSGSGKTGQIMWFNPESLFLPLHPNPQLGRLAFSLLMN